MVVVECDGPDARRAGYSLGADRRTEQLDRLLVGVGVGGPDVHDEPAGVGHDVVLRSGFYLRNADFHRSQ